MYQLLDCAIVKAPTALEGLVGEARRAIFDIKRTITFGEKCLEARSKRDVAAKTSGQFTHANEKECNHWEEYISRPTVNANVTIKARDDMKCVGTVLNGFARVMKRLGTTR